MQGDWGVYSNAELERRGIGDAARRRMCRGGRMVRLRAGWYATSQADPDVADAVRSGGVLGCVSALGKRGVWVPPHAGLHIRAGERAARAGRRRYCLVKGAYPPIDRAVDPPEIAVACAWRCLPNDCFVAACDSVLNSRLLTLDELATAVAAAPAGVRDLLARCDPAAQSGTESLVRVRLRSAGVGVRTQVPILGVGRVDLLVGDRLIVEVDSKAHHTSASQYATDRRRDRVSVTHGFLVMRVTYDDVMYGWDEVLADVRALVRRREHRRAPRMSA